jgi:L-alanine-DL-glutamate epimerase-like enolase superfamily enzyme
VSFLETHADDASRSVGDASSLRMWMADHAEVIDANPAAWCAMELAMLDAFARQAGATVDAWLGLPALKPAFEYSAVLGLAAEPAFSSMALGYARLGLRDYKLKLSGVAPEDTRNCQVLGSMQPEPRSIRVDANNLWPRAEEAIDALRALPIALAGVEEPIGAGRLDEMARVADAIGVPVILDETVTRAHHIAELPGPPERWVVNVRVSKMGGLLRSLDAVREARRRRVRVAVGAQVGETSLLTRVALSVATAADGLLLWQEGGFGTRLLTHDVCDPPLMFGAGGALDWTSHPGYGKAGFGIEPNPRR